MWYSVSLYFESLHSPPNLSEPVWEHRIVLIEATDEAMATRRAEEYGRNSEHSYPNQAGEVITWRFDSLDRIESIESESLADELEVFSRFLRASDVANLKRNFDD